MRCCSSFLFVGATLSTYVCLAVASVKNNYFLSVFVRKKLELMTIVAPILI